jgi:hypothetical protein
MAGIRAGDYPPGSRIPSEPQTPDEEKANHQKAKFQINPNDRNPNFQWIGSLICLKVANCASSGNGPSSSQLFLMQWIGQTHILASPSG